METANKVEKNFKVELTYFTRNKDAWVQCNVIFHERGECVHDALLKAVFKLDGVTLEQIEDARIEKEL